MKRYCNILFFLFSILYFGNRAECTNCDRLVAGHNVTFFTAGGNINHGSSMQGKKPHNEYMVIIFRNGIEGKGYVFPYKSTLQSAFCFEYPSGIVKINSARVKYESSFSDSLPLSPEFFSSLLFRGPPVLC